MPSTPASFTLPFVKKEQLNADTYSFYFDRTKHEFEFDPGQYMRMILPHDSPDDRGTSRFFTIASSPLQKDFLMHTTKIIKSSFKQTLNSLQPGQEVQYWGPTGKFVLQEDSPRPLVFIAGGVGITPYHSMLIFAAQKNLTLPLTLFVSFSIPEEIIYYDELTAIAKEHTNIKVIYTLTRPQESKLPWSGETGRVSEELIKKYIDTVSECTYYVSGPPPMVDGTDTLLKDMKISEEQIILEKFTGY